MKVVRLISVGVAGAMFIVGVFCMVFASRSYQPSTFFLQNHDQVVSEMIEQAYPVPPTAESAGSLDRPLQKLRLTRSSSGSSGGSRSAMQHLDWVVQPSQTARDFFQLGSEPVRIDIASLTALDVFRFALVASMSERFEKGLPREGFSVQVEDGYPGQKFLSYGNDRIKGIVRITSSLNADRAIHFDLHIYEH